MNFGPFNGLPFAGSVLSGVQTAVSNTDCTALWSDAASVLCHVSAETLDCIANLTASTYGQQYLTESISASAQLDANYRVKRFETGALSCSANLLDMAGVHYWISGNMVAQAGIAESIHVSSGQPTTIDRMMIVYQEDRTMVVTQ